MFSKIDTNSIDNYLKDKIKIIYNFDFNGLVFLFNKPLRSFIMGESVDELDFVLLTQKNHNIEEFLLKNHIKATLVDNFYQFIYKGLKIKIYFTPDLFYVGYLTTDYIFYDISRSKILSYGIKEAIQNKSINVFRPSINNNSKSIKEAKKFINFFTKKKTKVKYKYNKLFSYFKKEKDLKLTKNLDYLKNVDTGKLDNFVKEKFNIINDFDFYGIKLLYGGAIRNLIMDREVRDLDLAILSQDECKIKEFISKYKLEYRRNYFGGYKINYNGFEVDIFTTDDMFIMGVYDSDFLFYDLDKHSFIINGAIHSYNNKKITEINNAKAFPLKVEKERIQKIITFIKFITNSNNIKVKTNLLYSRYKVFKRRLKLIYKEIFDGNFKRCFKFLNGCKNEYKILVLLGILVAIISSIIPALSAKIITNVMSYDFSKVIIITLMLTAVKASSIICSFFISKYYLCSMKKMIFNIRKEIASNVLDFNMENFNTNKSGAFINKIKDDPNDIVVSFNKIKDILINGLGNLFVLFYVFFLSWQIGIVFVIFMIIILNIKRKGIRKKNYERRKLLKEQEKYASIIGEMINGIVDIKALNLKGNYMNKVINSFEEASNLEYKGEYVKTVYDKISKIIEFIAFGIIIILGLFLIKKDLLSTSSMVVIVMYKSNIFTFLDRFTYFMDIRASFNLSCERIFILLDSDKYSKEKFGIEEKSKRLGTLEFKNVNFSYNLNNKVLNNCSFKIESNNTVALVGKSGSGKTTILNLISKLYNIDNNKIFIDGTDINCLSEKYIKSNVSIISQNPYLFDMSIKDNLRLVKENITDEEIIDVCNKVYLKEFIEKLPKKYDTIVGEGAVQLSGGQKQRLAIARALIKNTSIILLDEITSALDNETSAIIKKVVDNISQNHTVIIVTHEISMIKDCNKILVLDDGKIINEGRHSYLIKNCDVYKSLYKAKR